MNAQLTGIAEELGVEVAEGSVEPMPVGLHPQHGYVVYLPPAAAWVSGCRRWDAAIADDRLVVREDGSAADAYCTFELADPAFFDQVREHLGVA